jgi:homoserine O-succinyltransferase
MAEDDELLLTRRTGALSPGAVATPFAPRLRIGLVNNMPDAAMCATERQFGDLLAAAAGVVGIELVLLSLPGVPRGSRSATRMTGLYREARGVALDGLDGLIVTGAEPRTPRLDDEAYWPELARLADWTRAAGVPTIWSCLAAHAAVLHFDGIERRPLAAKLTGVFRSTPASSDPLVEGPPHHFATPHSRLNGLDAGDLARHGYDILTMSPVAGVDAFVRRDGGAPQLFLQGHPEYDPDTLMREYLRDVGRFLRGERPAHPKTPSNYLDPGVEARLDALAERARHDANPARLAGYEAVLGDARPKRTWRGSAVRLYRGWLEETAAGARQQRAQAVS